MTDAKRLGNMFISAAILLGFFMIVACMGWMKKEGCTIGSIWLAIWRLSQNWRKAMRLIDSDALREYWLENGQNEYVYDTNSFLDSIDEAPTVDAVEVVHGRWEKANNRPKSYIRVCSVCGKEAYFCGKGCTYKYCPNCLSKMDGKINEDM